MKKSRYQVNKETLSATDRLFFENETKTNRLGAGCMLVLLLLTAAFGFINLTRLSGTRYEWTGWVLTGCSILELFLYLQIRFFGYEDLRAKYLVLIGLILLSCISFFLFPLPSVFILFGPAMVSIKYYRPKLTVKVTGIAWLFFLLAAAANIILGRLFPEIRGMQLEQGMTLWAEPLYVLEYYVFPRTAVYLLEGVVGYRIAKAGRDLVITQAAVSTQAAVMSAELSTAAKVQGASLPAPDFVTPDGNMNLSAYVRTARDVGGDFYDYFMISDHLLTVTIADVSDKGLPSAMYAVEAQSFIRFAFSESLQKGTDGSIESADIEKAVNAVNRQLSIHNMDGMFVTMWIGCFDTRTGAGKFINAGHNRPYIRHADGTVSAVENEPQFFLGAFENAELRAKTIRLRTGDSLLLYTDGAADARNGNDETFGNDRLKKALTEAVPEKDRTLPESLIRSVSCEIGTFIGEKPPYDDITLTALQYTGAVHTEKISFDLQTGETCASEAAERINARLAEYRCTEKFRRNLDVIIDEICTNISLYAYHGVAGPLKVEAHFGENFVTLRFTDSGIPFDPLQAEEPEIEQEPQIGGLGIYLVKQLADGLTYRYEDGKNILTVTGIWNM